MCVLVASESPVLMLATKVPINILMNHMLSHLQAVSQLPQLTLLTSLTPSAEPLRVNPARPHAGLDLGMLATRSCLNGLDVAVMQPEHLATLGQFTALQRLNLR